MAASCGSKPTPTIATCLLRKRAMAAARSAMVDGSEGRVDRGMCMMTDVPIGKIGHLADQS